MMHERRAPLRTAGLIAGAVLLAIIVLALHPHVSGHPAPQAELRDIATLGARGRLVHGTLLLLVGALLIGSRTTHLAGGVHASQSSPDW